METLRLRRSLHSTRAALVSLPAHTHEVAEWEILSTPSMSGADNMAYDVNTLRKMQHGHHIPVLRFFRWKTPGASFGKHQSLEKLQKLIPSGLEAVQRPT